MNKVVRLPLVLTLVGVSFLAPRATAFAQGGPYGAVRISGATASAVVNAVRQEVSAHGFSALDAIRASTLTSSYDATNAAYHISFSRTTAKGLQTSYTISRGGTVGEERTGSVQIPGDFAVALFLANKYLESNRTTSQAIASVPSVGVTYESSAGPHYFVLVGLRQASSQISAHDGEVTIHCDRAYVVNLKSKSVSLSAPVC
jgi:hypothetical protein